MAIQIGSLLIKLGLDSGEFKSGLSVSERELRKSAKRIQAIGQQMQGIGQRLSIAVTAPIIALGVASVKAAMESKDALGQVESALKSMGDVAGRTSEQLQSLASDQMRHSLYDDDEILRKVSANLLTFGKIAEAQFDRAQQSAIDLSARLGTDLQSSAIMLGKALNDPIKGITALTRVGVSFTAQQKEQIKALAEAGKVAEAQRLILSELEQQYGGAAQAARDANPLAAAQMSWADFQETIGEKLLPLLPPLTNALTKVLDVFGQLSPGMQTAVIAGAGLAAVLGPILIGLGALVSAAAPFISVIGAIGAAGGVIPAATAAIVGLGAAFGPILVPLAAVAAAGYLIYENWDKVAPVLEDLWATISETLGPPLTELIEALKGALTSLWQGPLGQAIRAVTPYIVEFGRLFAEALGEKLVSAVKAAATAIGFAFEAIAVAIRIVTSVFELSLGVDALNAVKSLYDGVKTWLQNKLGAVLEWVRDKVKLAGEAFAWLYDVVVGNSYIPDMVDEIGQHMARLDAVLVKPVTAATKAAAKKFQDLRDLMDRLFPSIGKANQYNADLAALEGAGLSPEALAEASARLWRDYVSGSPFGGGGMGGPDFGSDGGPIADTEQAMRDLGSTMDSLAKKSKLTTVRIAETFKDMAEKTVAALGRLGEAIKGGGFLNILESVIGLGLQLGSVGAFGKGVAARINATPRANGGPVQAGKPYLIGERGPEYMVPGVSGTVIPNRALGGVTNNYFTGNLLTPEFWSEIRSGDVQAAQGGAALAGIRSARSRKWSLA